MDSDNRGADKMLPQDPLHWENMKDGIFEKVLAEDPDFFERRRRRRGVIWFGSLTLVVIAIVLSVFLVKDLTEQPVDQTPSTNSSALDVAQADSKEPSQNFVHSAVADKSAIANIESDSEMALRNGEKSLVIAESAVDQNQSAGQPLQIDEIRNAGINDVTSVTEVGESAQQSTGSITAETVRREQINHERLKAVPYASFEYSTDEALVRDAHQTTPTEATMNLEQSNDDQKVSGTWRLFAAGGWATSSTRLAGNSTAVGLRNDNTTAHQGFHIDLGVEAPLGKSLFAIASMSYQQSLQEIDISTEREVEVTKRNVLLHVTHFVVGNRSSEVYGDTTVIGIEKNRLHYTNTYRWVHLNAGAGYRYTRAGWSVSPTLGAAFGRMWAQGYTVANDGAIIPIDGENAIYRAESYKLWGGVAVERAITSQLNLSLGYRFDKQLNNASSEEGVEFKPLFHRVSVGLSVNLGR